MERRKRTRLHANNSAGSSSLAETSNVEDHPCENPDNDVDEADLMESQCTNPVAMNEALRNPLVLSKIMEILCFLDLQTCRLVCQSWLTISSSIMLKKDCCCIKLKYDWERGTYRQYRQPTSRLRKKIVVIEIPGNQYVVEFNKILQKSTNFPSNHFVIFGGNLGEPNIQSFFDIQGSKIKSLALMDIWDDDDDEGDFTSKQIFRQVLTKVPNVEHLTLRDLDFDWDEGEDGLSLPSLKNFSWEGGCETANRIMTGAPTFKTLENFDLQDPDHLNAVIKADKAATVKELVCDEYTSSDDLITFLKSGGPQLRLQRIEFDVDKYFVKEGEKVSLTMAFNKLLDVSKNTVEILDLSELCSAYQVRLPNFSRLKELAIGRKFAKPAGRCFPPLINLTTTFPTLKLLDCTGVRCDIDASWNKHFPPPDAFCGNFASVETLEILDSCREFWIDKLNYLCPNFKKLIVYSEDQPHIILPKIFRHWQHLEAIEIRIQGLRLFNLDSAFTGISAKNCARLRLQESEEREEGFENLSYRSGICALNGLKSLKMRFDPDSYREFANVKKTILISRVSGLYAFKLMPDLKVTIEFDHNCTEASDIKSTFASISPYVNFAHNHNCFD